MKIQLYQNFHSKERLARTILRLISQRFMNLIQGLMNHPKRKKKEWNTWLKIWPKDSRHKRQFFRTEELMPKICHCLQTDNPVCQNTWKNKWSIQGHKTNQSKASTWTKTVLQYMESLVMDLLTERKVMAYWEKTRKRNQSGERSAEGWRIAKE